MRKISFKALKEQPMRVKVLYTIAVIFCLIGVVTMLLDAFEICEIKLCVSMAFIVAANVINNVILLKKKDQLYR